MQYYNELGYFFCEISFRISLEIPNAESGILYKVADLSYFVGNYFYNKGA
jgi:hypothetical protein